MSPSKFEAVLEAEGEIRVLRLSGPVDSTTIEQFKNALENAFKHDGVKVLLECSDLTYINSRAIGLLTAYHRNCYAHAGRMALCNINSKIVRTLDLLHIGKVLKRFQTFEEAVAALRE